MLFIVNEVFLIKSKRSAPDLNYFRNKVSNGKSKFVKKCFPSQCWIIPYFFSYKKVGFLASRTI